MEAAVEFDRSPAACIESVWFDVAAVAMDAICAALGSLVHALAVGGVCLVSLG